ncbi:MAG: aryl-sulfate sulfotransferase [Bacteroidia bacterium]|nr:aryl-sulfate sulfotransferase [Bacteroidia bacterium]
MKSKLTLTTMLLLFAAVCLNAQQWGLYTLYAPINSTTAYLIDTNSTTYKTWTFSSTYKTGFSSYLIPGDTLVRVVMKSSNPFGTGGGGLTGEVQKVTWNGTVVWDYVYCSSTYSLHHDICPMPNGNVLMIVWVKKTATEVTAAGCSTSIAIWSEKIIEVKPTGATTGTIVWEWHLWDHLCQNYDALKPNYVTSIVNNPQLMNINYNIQQDWLHMNGIDYNADLDQITFSSRMMNEIYVIDHSATTAEAVTHSGGNSGKGGDFLYRWGNPAAYGAAGTTNFDVVHDAHWIPADNPNYPNYLAAFNNEGGTGGKSCIDIISPPYNGYNYSYTPGQTMPPSTYTYRHTSAFTSTNNGASQQLPNGNMLVCISFSGNMYEINSSGTTLWSKTVSGQIANAIRYDKCYVRGPIATAGASSTEVSAGTPVTLNSSATSVTETSPTYTYSWSSNPSGFTSTSQNPTVTPTTATTYTVIITDTNIGCSDTASVTINVITGINEVTDKNTMHIFPNPTTGIVTIEGNNIENTIFEITVYSPFGKILLREKNSKTIDMSGFENGIYFLTVKFENMDIGNKKIILIK